MSCPKCAPEARSRRWLWWAALAALVSAGAWLDRTGGARPSTAPAAGSLPATAR